MRILPELKGTTKLRKGSTERIHSKKGRTATKHIERQDSAFLFVTPLTFWTK